MWWDEERIRWYEKAAACSSFHRTLATEIEKHIAKDERILELGCGLGYAAEYLHNDGFCIKAADKDEVAIAEAKKRSHLSIFSTLDADAFIPCSDVLLMLFFGRIRENGNLDRFLGNTRKIIYIISEHRGQSDELRKSSGEPEATISFLKSRKDISFSCVRTAIDFPQPLDNEKDAERYIERMYGPERKTEYMKHLKHAENGLILPNHKHISIFIIGKRRLQ